MSAALRRTGITPDQLTALGLVLALAAGAVTAAGWLIPAAVLIGLCGLADLLDGPLAKATSSTSVRGAFFDSVADRLSDVFMLAGVAWYLVSSEQAHLAVLAFGALAASMLPSYVRAKAETLGLSARGGVMERAERMIALGLGLFLQPFAPVLVPVLWLILALSTLTAVQRFVSGWRQASVAQADPPAPPALAAQPVRAVPPAAPGRPAQPVLPVRETFGIPGTLDAASLPGPGAPASPGDERGAIAPGRPSLRHLARRSGAPGATRHTRVTRRSRAGRGYGAARWRAQGSPWLGSPGRSGRTSGSARRQGWGGGGPTA